MKPVVSFLQPEFLDILRSTPKDKLRFTVKELDEGSVLHVTAHECDNGGDESERRVFFTVVEEPCPDAENLAALVSSILQTEGQGVQERRLVIIVPKENKNSFSPMVFVELSGLDESREIKTEKAHVLLQPSREQLYSRSKGILESSLLEKSVVAVVGLGSGGSYVSLELAKAGVGNFILIDHDRLELHNIVRHVCGLNDLGRLKTNAMKDQLLNKNPFINVKLYDVDINDIEKAREILTGCDLIIAATDNSRSRLNINQLSVELGITAIYGKCSTRAAGGDVLRVRPGAGPCFSCVLPGAWKAAQEEISNLKQATIATPEYTEPHEIEAMVQVGLSSDIIPITNMIVKLALVELCRGRDCSLAPLEKDFEAPYYTWANRREGDLNYLPEDGFHKFNQPSILRWYPLSDPVSPEMFPVDELGKRKDCMTCGRNQSSIEDIAFFGQVQDNQQQSDENGTKSLEEINKQQHGDNVEETTTEQKQQNRGEKGKETLEEINKQQDENGAESEEVNNQ